MLITSSTVAVVTGAASGIGAGIAGALVQAGATVVVADIELSAATNTASQLREGGGTCIAAQVDVTKPESVSELGDFIDRELGGLDLLCNNAGVTHPAKPILELRSTDLAWVYDVNVNGVLNCCREFVPRLRARGAPTHIVNTCSENGLAVQPGYQMGGYAATKHALVALSKQLRAELDPDIAVSILCPAAVSTDLWNSVRNRPDQFGGPRDLRKHGDGSFAGMDPAEVGRFVVRGVERGDFYILTHPEVRAVVQAQHAELIAAFDAQFGQVATKESES